MMATKEKSIIKKLAVREISGLWRRHRKEPSSLLFDKIPSRMCYQLKQIVSHAVLEDGHVFLGFSKSGKFVLSYSLQVGGEQTSDRMLPIYDYKLQWWLFIPNKPLQLVSEVKLFGGDDIFRELFIAFCEWPEDDQKCLVYGQSIPSQGEDSCFCYVTITSKPCISRCLECQELRAEKLEGTNQDETLRAARKCLQHSFCVHSKYDMNPPYPSFSPGVQLKLEGTVILNTGVSLVALQVELQSLKSKPKLFDIYGNKPVIGSDLSLHVVKTVNTVDSVSSSPISNLSKGLNPKLCQECQVSQCSCVDSQNVNSPSNSSGYGIVVDSEYIISIETDKAKEFKLCEECNNCLKDCTCPKILRQPLQDKNCGGKTSKQSMSSPRPTVSGKHFSELLDETFTNENGSTSNDVTSDRLPTYAFSSPSPRICLERSFFSPSNSNSSVKSMSSEGVQVHTNIAKTVTYSSRCFVNQLDDVVDSQVSMEDEYDLAYRSILPVEASSNGKSLSIAKNESASSESISVLQMTFDIEPYMMETIHLEADWGRRFVAFYNYDLQLLDVEQDSQVLGTIYALIQAKETSEIPKRHCKVPVKLYRTQLTFSLDLCKGIYSTLNIGDLTAVQERNPEEFEWKLGNKECSSIRRGVILPKSYFRSVNMLSNECLFKGRSKKILMASHHSHTSAIIL